MSFLVFFFSLAVYGETVLTLRYVPHELIYLIFTYLSIDLRKNVIFQRNSLHCNTMSHEEILANVCQFMKK